MRSILNHKIIRNAFIFEIVISFLFFIIWMTSSWGKSDEFLAIFGLLYIIIIMYFHFKYYKLTQKFLHQSLIPFGLIYIFILSKIETNQVKYIFILTTVFFIIINVFITGFTTKNSSSNNSLK
jgi:hypothetical protein